MESEFYAQGYELGKRQCIESGGIYLSRVALEQESGMSYDTPGFAEFQRGYKQGFWEVY
jgi:hypothetical protein